MYYTTNTTFTTSYNNVFPKKEINLNFFDYVDVFLTKYGHRYSSETKKTYITQKSKLFKYKKNLKLDEITPQFLIEYEKYMKTVLNNNQNTVNKTFAFLKSTLNKAINDGLISKHHNPFNKIKIKRVVGHRAFLNIDELQRLHNLMNNTNNAGIKNVCTYFLFSCYTGLRFTDVKNLKYKHIVNNIIELKQHKTKDYVRIPLNNKAKNLINFENYNNNDFVFKVISNQKTNEKLKQIAVLAEINKTLSFHVARHTFATVGLSIGIPIEVISKLLGHTNIKTTQIYANVIDDVKIKEIEKFDTF